MREEINSTFEKWESKREKGVFFLRSREISFRPSLPPIPSALVWQREGRERDYEVSRIWNDDGEIEFFSPSLHAPPFPLFPRQREVRELAKISTHEKE